MTTSKLRAALLLTALLTASAASAASPRLTYSGTLQDAGGKPVTTSSALQFRFYAQEFGGAAVWEDAVLVTPDASGWFSAVLGASALNPILASDFAGPLWLGIQVSTDSAEMSPRMQVTSTPSAVFAASVDWAGVTNRPATYSVDPAAVQTRVAGTCPAGKYVQGVNQDGTVVCGTDAGGTLTGVTAGIGLTGGGGAGTIALAADFTATQRRVAGTCTGNSFVQSIDQNGGAACGNGNGGTITAVNVGWGLAGGGSSGAVAVSANSTVVQARVAKSCAPGSAVSGINADGSVVCDDIVTASRTDINCNNGGGCTWVSTVSPVRFCALRRISNVGSATNACELEGQPDGTWRLYANGGANCWALCF